MADETATSGGDLSDPTVTLQLGQAAGGGQIDGIAFDGHRMLDAVHVQDRNPALLLRHGSNVAYSPFVRHLTLGVLRKRLAQRAEVIKEA